MSPRLATMRRTLLVLPALTVLVVVVASLAVGATRTAAALLLGGGALLALAWRAIGRTVASWGYAERADDLLIRRGLLFRRLVVVPYGRMQFVDVKSGPLERRFGLAAVKLHTAAATTDAHLPGLLPDEAARLRDRLAARGQAQAAGL